MLLRNKMNNVQANNGDMINQFNQFKNQIAMSGKNPQQILNELVSSGKVNKQQLDKVVQMAKLYGYLLK